MRNVKRKAAWIMLICLLYLCVSACTSLQTLSVFAEKQTEETTTDSISLQNLQDLPSYAREADNVTDQASGMSPGRSGPNVVGIICWILVGIGVLIIVFILFSATRRPQRRRDRNRYYQKTTRRGKRKKRLLRDEYYRNSKYQDKIQ